ncbi:MAG: Gfo/Idh/MocA family oxidoreductase [Candidatus Melainabacteria bacterium]|nr:Gfo/Idh/MocA family oxidoreductase [Candidatus Melainabacteria bacterium]
MSKVRAILVGAGQRGTFVFGRYALDNPEKLRFTAVVEPDPGRRRRFASQHGLDEGSSYESFDVLARGEIEADIAVIATMDRQHAEPAILAMEAGYHVLLEKPMAGSALECLRLVETAQKTGRMLAVAHVLRYTPFFSRIKEIVSSGRLGDILSVEHFENVSYWHMAHSFVRGNWGNATRSGPMLLSKCCHDLDILVWMMSHTEPLAVTSRGSLSHFRPEKAPPGATDRCTDSCPAEEECAFFAPRFYLDEKIDPYFAYAITSDISPEGRLAALQTGPYGRCVYKCDNDVVDHQSVIIDFADGALATLVMHGLSDREGRTMRYDGSRASLRATFPFCGKEEIEIQDHLTGEVELVTIGEAGWGPHGGGDGRLIESFVEAVAEGRHDFLTGARTSLASHLMAFAAEESRLSGKTIDLAGFEKSIG